VSGVAEFVVVVFFGSMVAGVIGALAGLGGGVLIVPLLTIGLGVDIHYAIGASIVSVIATSSGAAAAYVRDRITNLRVGMFLELATTAGAIAGALLAGLLHPTVLYLVFGVVLAISVLPLVTRLGEELPRGVQSDRWATRLRLACSYYDAALGRTVAYQVTRVPAGLGMRHVDPGRHARSGTPGCLPDRTMAGKSRSGTLGLGAGWTGYRPFSSGGGAVVSWTGLATRP
jgi:uncharacterized membrane protein YfcA